MPFPYFAYFLCICHHLIYNSFTYLPVCYLSLTTEMRNLNRARISVCPLLYFLHLEQGSAHDIRCHLLHKCSDAEKQWLSLDAAGVLPFPTAYFTPLSYLPKSPMNLCL